MGAWGKDIPARGPVGAGTRGSWHTRYTSLLKRLIEVVVGEEGRCAGPGSPGTGRVCDRQLETTRGRRSLLAIEIIQSESNGYRRGHVSEK